MFALAWDDAKRHWLDELHDAEGRPIVRFVEEAIVVGGKRFAVRSTTPIAPVLDGPPQPATEYGSPSRPPASFPARVLRPSAATLAGTAHVAETVHLGPRLTLSGDPDMAALGEACHGFFACDDAARPHAWRVAMAATQLDAWGVPQLAPADLVAASDRLAAFLADRYPGATTLREWPAHRRRRPGDPRPHRDLLLELDDGFVLIDPKSFPGAIEPDGDRLAAFAGRVVLYGRAVALATGMTVVGYWMHQAVAGLVRRVAWT